MTSPSPEAITVADAARSIVAWTAKRDVAAQFNANQRSSRPRNRRRPPRPWTPWGRVPRPPPATASRGATSTHDSVRRRPEHDVVTTERNGRRIAYAVVADEGRRGRQRGGRQHVREAASDPGAAGGRPARGHLAAPRPHVRARRRRPRDELLALASYRAEPPPSSRRATRSRARNSRLVNVPLGARRTPVRPRRRRARRRRRPPARPGTRPGARGWPRRPERAPPPGRVARRAAGREVVEERHRLRTAALRAPSADERVAERAEQVRELVLTAEKTWRREHPREGLLDEVVGVLARPRPGARRAIEARKVLDRPVGIETARAHGRQSGARGRCAAPGRNRGGAGVGLCMNRNNDRPTGGHR